MDIHVCSWYVHEPYGCQIGYFSLNGFFSMDTVLQPGTGNSVKLPLNSSDILVTAGLRKIGNSRKIFIFFFKSSKKMEFF